MMITTAAVVPTSGVGRSRNEEQGRHSSGGCLVLAARARGGRTYAAAQRSATDQAAKRFEALFLRPSNTTKGRWSVVRF